MNSCPPPAAPHAEPPLAAACQLLVVRADDWHSPSGQLQRHARPTREAEWQPYGPAIPVVLGRAGLAWGIGRHPTVGDGAPVKREGDGRAPAGIFAITELFGYGDRASRSARSAKLPYRPATPGLKCIDDPRSRHYNRFVDLDEIAAIDWSSHEDMRRADERYAIGAVIAHNSAPPVAGAGSCIFLHVWQAAGQPTAGCTAGAPADIAAICAWLEAAAHPLLVQLPRAEYARFRTAWALP